MSTYVMLKHVYFGRFKREIKRKERKIDEIAQVLLQNLCILET